MIQREGQFPMSGGSIKDRERRAAEAYVRLRRGNTYDAWVAVGCGLLAGREWATQQAGAAKGARYNVALQQWQQRNRWSLALELKPPAASQAVWLIENLADVEAWRATLSGAERLAYHHPSTIQRHFLQAQSGDEPGGCRHGSAAAGSPQGDPSRPSKAVYDALRAAYDGLQRENAELKQKLAVGAGLADYPDYPLLWLKPPFTTKDAQAARNRMAKVCHPDGGGSDEQMQALNAEYQKALGQAER
jgi:hypothetical protein